MRFGTLFLLFVALTGSVGCASGSTRAPMTSGGLGSQVSRHGNGSKRASIGGHGGVAPDSQTMPAAATATIVNVPTVSAPIDRTARNDTRGIASAPVESVNAVPAASSSASASSALAAEGPRVSAQTLAARSTANPADVSGVWIWEHRGSVPTGDEKQEREEWHVDQQGDRISGYYDRVVREISTDGHAFRCSMGLEFEIATRYRIRGEVRGNQLMIYESSFEVLAPSACDNGQRRLDAYEGLATGDEVRLAWGVGAQVLRRPRPDVPTQHF